MKTLLTITLVVLYSYSYSQKKNIPAYKQEFKKFRELDYNINLISNSDLKPDKTWDNYKGAEINTTDSLFFFNGEYLCKAFPTNSDKIRNQYLAFYFSQKTAQCPTLFSLLKYYEPTIEKHLIDVDLPKELKLLPLVLSAFNPNSDNSIGGYGYWHLNYPQATKYGLTINNFVDDRSDFKKSTRAAINYIKDLHIIYNDWELVLTAYSCGVSSVNKLLTRHSAKTYKEIYQFLQPETKELVQAFVAMNYIYSYDDYGAVNLNPIIEMDTVHIERELQLKAINHVIGTNTKDIKFLNHVLTREIFPNDFTAFLPKGKGEKFTAFKDSIYFYQDSVLLKPISDKPQFTIPENEESYTYIVRSGDVLGLIADKYNVKISQLQEWNGLKGTRINVGQKLTVYGKKALTKKEDVVNNPKTNNEQQVTSNTKSQKSEPKTGNHFTYTVKSGENLWIIAKKYSGVSAQNIMDFNEIDDNLTVGQLIKIPKY